MKTNKLSLAVALLLAVVILASCTANEVTGVWADATYKEDTVLGEGEVALTVEVTAEDKTVVFTVKTDKTTVGEALLELGLIDGEVGAYGLYVKVVNGIVADYDIDGSYWAFYIGDDYSMTGVDTTPIEEGATYRLVHTK
jgi:hypothetical protein